MQTSIVQMIALTIAGNHILRGGALDPIWPGHSTFAYCERVEFLEGPDPDQARIVAPDPDAWLAALHGRRSSLRLRHAPRNRNPLMGDRMSSAFVGGGERWVIEALGESDVETWDEAWRLGDRGRKDRRIWRVAYLRSTSPRAGGRAAERPLPTIAGELRALLALLCDFARRREVGLDNFAPWFERATAALDSDDPLAGAAYHRDLDVAGALSLDARRLLAASLQAWVFGGMGSWNDGGGGFDASVQGEYDRLSEQLYQLLQEAAAAAANSTAP